MSPILPLLAPSAEKPTQGADSLVHRRIFGLDLLRALAILMVLFAHAQSFTSEQLPWTRYFCVGGMIGVELFFVLSGYLIGGQLLALGQRLNNRHELFTFYRRRWYRTVPNFVLYLLLNQLLWSLLGRHTPPLLPYLGFVQSWAWPHPAFMPEAWSLSIEEWFYLLTPGLIFLLLRRGLGTMRAFTTASLIFLILPLLLRMFAVQAWNLDWERGIRQTTVLRLDAIMYGMLAVAAHDRFPELWKRFRLPLLFSGLAILAWGVHHYFTVPLASTWRSRTILFSILPFGTALLVPFCSLLKTCPIPTVALPVERTAAWSYSLYLANIPVLVMLDYFSLAGPLRATRAGAIIMAILFFAGAYLLSWLTYTYCERPFLKLRSKVARHSTSEDPMETGPTCNTGHSTKLPPPMRKPG